MAFRFFRFLAKKSEDVSTMDCREMEEAARDFQIRELCFWVCVNLVANALGRCEIRTYQEGKEIKAEDYYRWNVEPNRNQSATAFMHELVARLYRENKALMGIRGREIYIARDYQEDDDRMETVYTEVDFHRWKETRLRERDVMRLELNYTDMRHVMGGLWDSYCRLINAAAKNYEYNGGQHWKVHVSQLARGQDGWMEQFMQMIEKQIKPFLTGTSSILPEFDGYDYKNVGQTEKKSDSTDLRELIAETFDMTARAFGIPAVLINGKIEGTQDANARFLTNCIDPLADQLAEEINRKRYGYDGWSRGSYVVVDTSSIMHFDMFANAANVEKLVGSGAFSINDVLKAAGHAPLTEAWADQHFITKNFENMADAVALAGS